MLVLSDLHRTQYRSSGKVDWARFLLSSIVLAFVSCVAGVVLIYAYAICRVYAPILLVIMPPALVVGYVMAWLTGGLVKWSHCRNIGIAFALGLACGCLVFVAEYQTMLVMIARQSSDDWVAEIARIDKTPGYIISRIQEDPLTPNSPNAAAIRSFFTFVELLILAGLPAWIASRVARCAYSERSKRFLNRSIVRALWNTGDRIVEQLQTGNNLSELFSTTGLCDANPRIPTNQFLQVKYRQKEDVACTWMELEFDPKNDGEWESAYLTAVEITPQCKQKRLFRQLELLPTEFAAARRLFAG